MSGRHALLVGVVVVAAATIGLVGFELRPALDVADLDLALAGTLGVGFLAFALAVGIGELLPLPRPDGGAVPLSVAVLASYAILVPSPVDAAAVALLGAGLAYLLALAKHEDHPTWHDVLAATVGGWMAAGVSAIGHHLGAGMLQGTGIDPTAVAMVLVAVAVVLGTPVWDAATRTDDRPLLDRALQRLRGGWLAGAALASAGLLGALVHPNLHLAALPLVLLPLLAARAGLRRHATVRETHQQTVRAFSRLPEELGTVPPGHGVRVADMAIGAGRELGIPESMLPALERAAHLHELGRIRGEPGELIDPEVVALDGASILREAGLDDVADIVGLHRQPGLHEVDPVAVAARIVRLACDTDRAIEERGEDGLPSVARRIADTEDLRVLGAITRAVAPQAAG